MYLIAHRGNDNHSFRENTINALISCLDRPYINGVELDVRITKNQEIIIYHNMFLLDKSNNICKISDKNLDEILEVKPYTSTLESFLSVIKTNKIIIIEIKEEGVINDKLINNLFKILKKYNYLNLYLCSFNYNLMKKIKLKYSNYKCGLIIGYLMNKNHVSNEFDFYLYSYNNINLINNDKEIFIFNVKNVDRLDKLKIKKEFYIITDKPYYFASL